MLFNLLLDAEAKEKSVKGSCGLVSGRAGVGQQLLFVLKQINAYCFNAVVLCFKVL